VFPISEADSSADAMEEQVEILIGQRDPQWQWVERLVTMWAASKLMNSRAIRMVTRDMGV